MRLQPAGVPCRFYRQERIHARDRPLRARTRRCRAVGFDHMRPEVTLSVQVDQDQFHCFSRT